MEKKKSGANKRHGEDKNVTTWLSPEALAALEKMAEIEDRTKSAIIRRALAFYARARNHGYPESETKWINLD